MTIIIVFASGIFLLLAILVLKLSGPEIKKTGSRRALFGYRLIYSDNYTGKKKDGVVYSKVLRSEKHGITGKPDYIYKNKFTGALMPVELKSGAVGDACAPYPGDLMQLAAYFVITEEEFSAVPRKGRIIYGDCMFIIKNTKKLRQSLFNKAGEMRASLQTEGASLGPCGQEFVKCRYCVCRETVCKR